MKRGGKSKVAVGIIDALAEVERATMRKIAEDIGCHVDSVRLRITVDLLPRRIVEEAGAVSLPGAKRKPMTYRLHHRLRGAAHA